MKYVKLFALAAGAFMLTACSDDNDFNSASDVTVEMAKSEITVKENAGTFNVPVKVTGDPNGPPFPLRRRRANGAATISSLLRQSISRQMRKPQTWK